MQSTPPGFTLVGQGVPCSKEPVIGLRLRPGKQPGYDEVVTIYDPERARDQWRLLDGSTAAAHGFSIAAWRYRGEGETD